MPNMNAIRFHPPGGPDKLRYEQAPKPQAREGEVLVKVCAASVIWPALSWPVYQAPDGSYPPHVPCQDFSGTVEELGPGVDEADLPIGSEVYVFNAGFNETGLHSYGGGAAEYAVAHTDNIALKPKNLSLRDAASVPLSALTAWQALHDHGNLQRGQRLLITGAAGATGIWAVQIARMMGAYVIGTAASKRSLELLAELGIDEIVNYREQSLDAAVHDVDLVLDTVGGDTLQQCARVVKPGRLVLEIVEFDAADRVPEGVRAKFFIVTMNRKQLEEITRCIEAGTLRTFIDSIFPLQRAGEAFEYGAKGHAHGKILLEV